MKNKVKIFIMSMALILSGAILGACGSNVYAEQNHPLKIWKENENGKYETLCLVDDNTGVNYVVVSGELYDQSVGIAITPRLNADGTLYTE
jgi:hypothetical protein